MASSLQLVTLGEPLEVVHDFGAVGSGASQARYVQAENGQEYIAKGPLFSPDNPYVGANEVIASLLARALGLPTLDFRLLRLGHELLFGSAWMQRGTWTDNVDDRIFAECINKDVVYDVVAFDVWIANIDRGPHNFVTRTAGRQRPGQPRQRLIMVNDHSHAVVPPQLTAADLGTLDSLPLAEFVKVDCVRRHIRSPALLRSAIAAVEDFDPGAVAATVEAVPEGLLPRQDVAAIRDNLVRRAGRVRSVIAAGSTMFPNLGAFP